MNGNTRKLAARTDHDKHLGMQIEKKARITPIATKAASA